MDHLKVPGARPAVENVGQSSAPTPLPRSKTVRPIYKYRIPFDTLFMDIIPSGPLTGKPLIDWIETKTVMKQLRKFKRDFVDREIIWEWLIPYLGPDFAKWPETLDNLLGYMGQEKLDLAQIAEEEPEEWEADIFLLLHIFLVVGAADIPGYDVDFCEARVDVENPPSRIDRYRVAGRLLLTVIKDLMVEDEGYFTKKLGGREIMWGFLPDPTEEAPQVADGETARDVAEVGGREVVDEVAGVGVGGEVEAAGQAVEEVAQNGNDKVRSGRVKKRVKKRGCRGGKSRRKGKEKARLRRIEEAKESVGLNGAVDADERENGDMQPAGPHGEQEDEDDEYGREEQDGKRGD
jgi:hypothetical protein